MSLIWSISCRFSFLVYSIFFVFGFSVFLLAYFSAISPPFCETAPAVVGRHSECPSRSVLRQKKKKQFVSS